MAPIDPAQLLKALDPLLFDDCAIKEASASQFSSLMKKFSKKLVSRCVYINVLKITQREALEKLLDQGGWNTINIWLTEATETKNYVFLIKLLELFNLLPINDERLSENSSSELVKSLTICENERVRLLSQELITKWATNVNEGDVGNIIIKIEKPQKLRKSKMHKEIKDLEKGKEKKAGKKDVSIKKEKNTQPKLKSKKRSFSETSDSLSGLSNSDKAEMNGEPLPKKSKLSKSKKRSIFAKNIRTYSKSVVKSETRPTIETYQTSENHESKLSPNSESKILCKSESKPFKSELKTFPRFESKYGVKSETKPVAKSETKPVVKSEIKPVIKPKSETKPLVKSDVKPILKSEPKFPLKSESKSLLKSESKSVLKSESKRVLKSGSEHCDTKSVKSESKRVLKSGSEHCDTKSVKSDLKSVNSDSKHAAKAETKSELFHKKAKIELFNKSSKKILQPAIYEDVKIELKPDLSPKKSKLERPKTVKSFQGKFRSTGLEEAPPLPKKIPKKVSTVDKNAAAVAAKNAVAKRLTSTLPEMITEKKIKPESLLNINEASTYSGGIKLIPAKPRSAPVLQESGVFMNALDAALEYPVKRKKKNTQKVITKLAETAPPPSPPTPTSPPANLSVKPSKLQFYKDTLEMNAEETTKPCEKEKVVENNTDAEEETVKASEADNDSTIEEEKAELKVLNSIPTEDFETKAEDVKNNSISDVSNIEKDGQNLPKKGLYSILSLGRQNKPKKTVSWVQDDDLKTVHYFELDESERGNFGARAAFSCDLKYIEVRRERELFDAVKRHPIDRMVETTSWWVVPIIVQVPPPLIEPGCFSQERETQSIRQQSKLQAIYFTRDMIPDSPMEPDSEFFIPQETKIIPLDEETSMNSAVDFTAENIPPSKSSLPEVLASLMSIPMSKPISTQFSPTSPMMQHQNVNLGPSNTPYDPGEPVSQVQPNISPLNNLQQIPVGQPMFGAPQIQLTDSISEHRIPVPSNIGAMSPNVMMQEPQFFHQTNVFPMNINPFGMMDLNLTPMGMPMGPPSAGGDRDEREDRRGGNNSKNNHQNSSVRQMQQRGRPLSLMGQPPFPRQQGPRGRGVPRVPCRHFAANGRCRFGINCTFLHPGVNGPPL